MSNDMKDEQKISGIHLDSNAVYQPRVRESIWVGEKGVTAIKYRYEDFGHHGEVWYDVYINGNLLHSVSSKAVAIVHRAHHDNEPQPRAANE